MTAKPGQAHFGLVVEGPGDKGAFPILLRNYLQSKAIYDDLLGKPVPLKGKGSATRPSGLEGYVLAAARPGCLAVIVLIDADKDASCKLGPDLLARAQAVTGVPVIMVIAERDFEDWIGCSIETLDLGVTTWSPTTRGKTAIEAGLAPEPYLKSTMQARLTSRMDIDLARSRNTSLDRLFRKVDSALAGL